MCGTLQKLGGHVLDPQAGEGSRLLAPKLMHIAGDESRWNRNWVDKMAQQAGEPELPKMKT